MTNDYAIITTGGHQHRVREGDTISIQGQKGQVGDDISFGDVVLSYVQGNLSIGSPFVLGVKVTGKVLSHGRLKKVISLRYKNKTRHRVKTGHRQPVTSVAITNIIKSSSKASKSKKLGGKNNGS